MCRGVSTTIWNVERLWSTVYCVDAAGIEIALLSRCISGYFLLAVSPFEMAFGREEGFGVRNDAEAYRTIGDTVFSSIYAFHWFGL